jgi:mRNA interferase RelE/StbE
MIFDLQFLPTALKEWEKLGGPIREQFKKKLAERLQHPRTPKDALHGLPDHYKIKLRDAGYRLVYRVEDRAVTVTVVAVGKRERNRVYKDAARRG